MSAAVKLNKRVDQKPGMNRPRADRSLFYHKTHKNCVKLRLGYRRNSYVVFYERKKVACHAVRFRREMRHSLKFFYVLQK